MEIMKVVIEKEEAHTIMFEEKDYPVIKNFVSSDILGFAKVYIENGIMQADLKLIKNANGYPAVGYTTNGKFKKLFAIGICDNPNEDKSIHAINYTTK